jgi:hypothetical protein
MPSVLGADTNIVDFGENYTLAAGVSLESIFETPSKVSISAEATALNAYFKNHTRGQLGRFLEKTLTSLPVDPDTIDLTTTVITDVAAWDYYRSVSGSMNVFHDPAMSALVSANSYDFNAETVTLSQGSATEIATAIQTDASSALASLVNGHGSDFKMAVTGADISLGGFVTDASNYLKMIESQSDIDALFDGLTCRYVDSDGNVRTVAMKDALLHNGSSVTSNSDVDTDIDSWRINANNLLTRLRGFTANQILVDYLRAQAATGDYTVFKAAVDAFLGSGVTSENDIYPFTQVVTVRIGDSGSASSTGVERTGTIHSLWSSGAISSANVDTVVSVQNGEKYDLNYIVARLADKRNLLTFADCLNMGRAGSSMVSTYSEDIPVDEFTSLQGYEGDSATTDNMHKILAEDYVSSLYNRLHGYFNVRFDNVIPFNKITTVSGTLQSDVIGVRSALTTAATNNPEDADATITELINTLATTVSTFVEEFPLDKLYDDVTNLLGFNSDFDTTWNSFVSSSYRRTIGKYLFSGSLTSDPTLPLNISDDDSLTSDFILAGKKVSEIIKESLYENRRALVSAVEWKYANHGASLDNPFTAGDSLDFNMLYSNGKITITLDPVVDSMNTGGVSFLSDISAMYEGDLSSSGTLLTGTININAGDITSDTGAEFQSSGVDPATGSFTNNVYGEGSVGIAWSDSASGHTRIHSYGSALASNGTSSGERAAILIKMKITIV